MAKRYPLPKRFNAALSEKAYARLRALNDEWSLGNNYVLVVLLEHLDEIVDPEQMESVFRKFIDEYGSPSGGIKKPT